MKNSEHLRQALHDRRVYPTVHRYLPKDIDENEFDLFGHISRHILTIPNDERYNIGHMNYVLTKLKETEKCN